MTRNGGVMESLAWHLYEHSFWKWHRNVPVMSARLLAAVSIHYKKFHRNPYYVQLPSYDGSRQLTHPDVVCWRGNIWLTATPYPFSLESYEDPCVYQSRDGNRFRPCHGAYPLVKINEDELGRVHYSDPVLLPTDDSLNLFYRKRARAAGAVIDSLHRSSWDGNRWNPPVTISESSDDTYISPAVLSCNEGYIMFHINLNAHQQTGRLIQRRSGNGLVWGSSADCTVNGLKPETGLWHIAVCAADGGRHASDGRLIGLFVVKNTEGEYIGVYHAASLDSGLTWYIGGRLALPLQLARDTKKPYKASFIPGSDDVMIALEDLTGRWYIYRIPGIFCESGKE